MAYSTSDDVYRAGGITSNDVPAADIDEFISEADEYLDNYFNTTFETKQITELRDGSGTNSIYTQYYPIVSVDSLDIDGTSVTPSEIYVYTGTGKLRLKTSAEVAYFKNTEPQQVDLTYTFGYNLDFVTITNNNNLNRVAYLIRSLSAKIAAIQALTNQIGGTFDDVTSYQLPEFSASKGEPFTNIRETIFNLQKQLDASLKNSVSKTLARNVNFC